MVWVCFFSSNKPFKYDNKDGHLLDTRTYLKRWEIVWKWGLRTRNAWIVDIPRVWVTLPNHKITGVKLSYKNRQTFPATAYWFCFRYDIQFLSSFFSFFWHLLLNKKNLLSENHVMFVLQHLSSTMAVVLDNGCISHGKKWAQKSDEVGSKNSMWIGGIKGFEICWPSTWNWYFKWGASKSWQ